MMQRICRTLLRWSNRDPCLISWTSRASWRLLQIPEHLLEIKSLSNKTSCNLPKMVNLKNYTPALLSHPPSRSVVSISLSRSRRCRRIRSSKWKCSLAQSLSNCTWKIKFVLSMNSLSCLRVRWGLLVKNNLWIMPLAHWTLSFIIRCKSITRNCRKSSNLLKARSTTTLKTSLLCSLMERSQRLNRNGSSIRWLLWMRKTSCRMINISESSECRSEGIATMALSTQLPLTKMHTNAASSTRLTKKTRWSPKSWTSSSLHQIVSKKWYRRCWSKSRRNRGSRPLDASSLPVKTSRCSWHWLLRRPL